MAYAGEVGVSGDFMPTFDPTSTGVFMINATTISNASGPVATALAAGLAGNGTQGNIWLGATSGWGSLKGTSLAPAAGNVYQFTDTQMGGSVLNIYNGETCRAPTR